MGFRKTQGDVSLTGSQRSYIVSYDKRADKGGLPNGNHTFVLGIGETNKSKKGEFMTVEELTKQSIIYNHAQLYIAEAGENGQYVHWHYTLDPHDPIVELGYGYENKGMIGNTKSRNEAKLSAITNGKGLFNKYLLRQVHLPVLHIPGDGTDLSAAKPAILIVTAASADAIFRQADALKMSSKNKSIKGCYLTLKKDTNQGMKAYDWRLVTGENIYADSPEKAEEFDKIFKDLFDSEIDILEGIYEDVNGGDSESTKEAAQKVWDYLCNLSGLTYEEFTDRYGILPNATVNANPSSVVNFGDDDDDGE